MGAGVGPRGGGVPEGGAGGARMGPSENISVGGWDGVTDNPSLAPGVSRTGRREGSNTGPSPGNARSTDRARSCVRGRAGEKAAGKVAEGNNSEGSGRSRGTFQVEAKEIEKENVCVAAVYQIVDETVARALFVAPLRYLHLV